MTRLHSNLHHTNQLHPNLLHSNQLHPGVAHALMRAVFALLRTQVCQNIQGVHMSVNAARMSACATRVLGLSIRILGVGIRTGTRVMGLGALSAVSAFAQEAEPSDPHLGWKWANFAILALGLGYLIRKHAPAFFQQRSQDIQQGILEAAQVKKDAEERSAEIDRRMDGLESEIAGLRAGAKAEIASEGERIRLETDQRLKRIEAQSAQEIALMARNARLELRKFSAQLALDLAQQRIGSRMNKDVQDGLVDGFLQDLRSQATQDARN